MAIAMSAPCSRTILFLRSSQRCTGLERRILLVAAAVSAEGFAPHVGVFYRHREGLPSVHPLVEMSRSLSISATQIDDPTPLSLNALRQLRGVVDDVRPAIVHTHDYRTDLAAFLVARGRASKVRLVATAHGYTGADWRVRFYEKLDRRILRRFPRIVCASQHQCQVLRQWGFSERQTVHLSHPIEPDWRFGLTLIQREESRRRWGVADDERLIGFLGRGSQEKGLDVLLDAFAAVRLLRPGVRLVVAGDVENHLSNTTRRGAQPAPAGVRLIGYQTNPRPVLAACDLIVVPSRVEAFGLVALEALALGLPVIATRCGGLPEIIRDGETGRLVPPNDAGALARALLEALDDWPSAQERGRRGQEDVLARFDPAAILPQAVGLYLDVLGGI
jgi:glycogen(starch) synthase